MHALQCVYAPQFIGCGEAEFLTESSKYFTLNKISFPFTANQMVVCSCELWVAWNSKWMSMCMPCNTSIRQSQQQQQRQVIEIESGMSLRLESNNQQHSLPTWSAARAAGPPAWACASKRCRSAGGNRDLKEREREREYWRSRRLSRRSRDRDRDRECCWYLQPWGDRESLSICHCQEQEQPWPQTASVARSTCGCPQCLPPTSH